MNQSPTDNKPNETIGKITEETILEYCEVCGAPLTEGELYGSDDFPMCRLHHQKFIAAVRAMVILSNSEYQQPVLFS